MRFAIRGGLALILALLLLQADALFVSRLWRQAEALDFPTVHGFIVESSVSFRSTATDSFVSPDIRFLYCVGDEGLVASRYRYFPTPPHRSLVESLVREHPPGSVVNVYFNPLDPTDALLSPGVSGLDLKYLLLLLPLHVPVFLLGSDAAHKPRGLAPLSFNETLLYGPWGTIAVAVVLLPLLAAAIVDGLWGHHPPLEATAGVVLATLVLLMAVSICSLCLPAFALRRLLGRPCTWFLTCRATSDEIVLVRTRRQGRLLFACGTAAMFVVTCTYAYLSGYVYAYFIAVGTVFGRLLQAVVVWRAPALLRYRMLPEAMKLSLGERIYCVVEWPDVLGIYVGRVEEVPESIGIAVRCRAVQQCIHGLQPEMLERPLLVVYRYCIPMSQEEFVAALRELCPAHVRIVEEQWEVDYSKFQEEMVAVAKVAGGGGAAVGKV